LILAVSATAGFPAKFSVPRSIPRKIAVENPGEYADNATINYTEVAMSLGRFTAYFCLLMIACLVVYPRSFGPVTPSASAPVIQDLPPGCTVMDDDSLTCTPLPSDPMRRHPGETDALARGRSRRLEAGGPGLLTPAVLKTQTPLGSKAES
jgi:hypothetical protein